MTIPVLKLFFPFQLDSQGQAYPLVVAGGGGGLSVGAFRDDGSQHGRAATNGTPESGYMYGHPGKTSGMSFALFNGVCLLLEVEIFLIPEENVACC